MRAPPLTLPPPAPHPHRSPRPPDAPPHRPQCECMNDTASIFDNLKAQFLTSYNGNRAPFPIFVHIYWLKAADNLEQLQRFMGAARDGCCAPPCGPACLMALRVSSCPLLQLPAAQHLHCLCC